MAGPYIEADPLSPEEMRQLRDLLLRYFTHHAAGLANSAVEKLMGKFRRMHVPKIIDITSNSRPRRKRAAPKRKRAAAS